MKTITKTILIALLAVIAWSGSVNAQQTTPFAIPDANFFNYLINRPAINTNFDGSIGFISVAEAANYTGGIFVPGLSIADLTGISAFTALTSLICNSNQLTSLNVSANSALTQLECGGNRLTSLNVSTNTALTTLFCWFNQLTSLNVSTNTALVYLDCGGNQLTSLNVSANTALTALYCYNNQLTSLNVSANTALNSFNCQDNQLTSLNVQNGNNSNMPNGNFNASGNLNLTCIQVDNVGYSSANWLFIDAGAHFSTNCSGPSASPQTFCGSATVANLVATGSNLTWYSVATSGTALASSTALATGTYYVSQTVGGVESERVPVDITITTTPVPTGVSTQSFSSGATIADLVATGTAIQWYASPTGGTALAPTTPIVNGAIYYASQTVNGCESGSRLGVLVNITNPSCTYFTKISGGGTFGVGIKSDGTLWVWGMPLGERFVYSRRSPVQVGTANNWVMVSAGYNNFLGITNDGKLWAWGQNDLGQLGDGTTNTSNNLLQIGNASNWVSVSASTGGNHSLGVTSDGKLWAWGWNEMGQLGNGTFIDKHSPIQVGTATNWVSVSAGTDYSLGLTSGGEIWSWGNNDYGQLGRSNGQQQIPSQIGIGSNWTSIEAGCSFSYGITNDGKLWAWGQNAGGSLGDGTTINRYSPIQIGVDTNWSSVSAKCYLNLGITNDGKLWQLNSPSLSPAQIGNSSNWISASASYTRSIGITNDRKSWAWGSNEVGQLGDGTITDRTEPGEMVHAYSVSYDNSTVNIGKNTSFKVITSETGLTYQWQVSTNGGFDYTDISNGEIYDNANTNSLAIIGTTNLMNGYLYRCSVSGGCFPFSSIITLKINSVLCSVVGSTTNVTYATTPDLSTVTYLWQYRVTSTSKINPAWINITVGNAGSVYSNYTTGTLSITKTSLLPLVGTQYRVIKYDSRGSQISENINLNILGATKAGTITANPAKLTICNGGSIDFTLGGYVGTSIQWQTASTLGSTTAIPPVLADWSAISGATNTIYTTGVLTTASNRFYRAVVTNSCSGLTATTAVKSVTVSPLSNGGTITGGGAVCLNSPTKNSIQVTGSVGIIQWQYSLDNGGTWTNAPSGTSLVPNNIGVFTTTSTGKAATYIVYGFTQDTRFRVTVKSGVCSSATSVNYVACTLTSAVATSVSATNNTVCSGTSTTLTLASGYVGTIKWFKSTDNWVTTLTVSGTTPTVSSGNLTLATAFKARLTIGGTCVAETTPITINVFARPVAKPISSTTASGSATNPICASTFKVLTIGNGYFGDIQWETAVTPLSSTTVPLATDYTPIVGETGASYTVSNASAGKNYFRAKFTIAGCTNTAVYSAAFIVYYNACRIAETIVTPNPAKLSFDVIASPNPYTENFNLSLSTSSEENVGIIVYDMIGRLIEQRNVRPSEVDALQIGNNYPSGVYNIVVNQGTEVKTLRVVKQ